MKVFISWSGARSKNIAEILRSWLPKVIQAVRPWMSDEDISTGTRWSAEIASELEKSKAGIVCITPENQHNPWLMFEAGALSKTLTETFVCPYLFDLSTSQLSGPISQFQATLATREGTSKIIQTLNKALGESQIHDSELEEIFDVWWPKLEEKMNTITKASDENIVKRSTDDILEEILKNSREQMRREEIRLNAFQVRDEKMDNVMKIMEGWAKPLSQASILMESLKEKTNDLTEINESHLGDYKTLANFEALFNKNKIGELINAVDGIPNHNSVVEIMKNLEELRVDSKEETDLLLNPEKSKKE